MSKQYKVRIKSNKVIGPFSTSQLIELFNRNHITGQEQFQLFPDGSWKHIGEIDDEELSPIVVRLKENGTSGEVLNELDSLENERKKNMHKEFVYNTDGKDENNIDATKLLNEYDEEEVKKNIIDSFKNRKGNFGLSTTLNHPEEKSKNNQDYTKTRMNPLAENIKEEENIFVTEEKEHNVEETQKHEVAEVKYDVDRFDKTEVFNLDKHLSVINKKVERYEDKIAAKQQVEDEVKSKKKSGIILALLVLAALYFYFGADDDDALKSPVFAKITYPIIKDVENVERAKVLYEKGLKLYARGRYIDKLKAASYFRESYENKKHETIEINGKKQLLLSRSLGNLILSYAEIFENVATDKVIRKKGERTARVKSAKAKAGTVIYQLLELAKGKALTDVNSALGKAIFYIKLKKFRTAKIVFEEFSLLADAKTSYKSNNMRYKFYSYYLDVLVELNLEGNEKAINIYKSISPSPKGIKKPVEVYYATSKYLMAIGKEKEARAEISVAAKLYKDRVGPLLRYAHLLIEEREMLKTQKILHIVKLLQFERSPVFYSEFIEIMGMKLALDGKLKSATKRFNVALRIHDNERLRSKLAELELGKADAVDKLILQSKVLRLVEKSKRLKRRMKTREALYVAIRAVDLSPSNILANIQLADIQTARGYYKAAVKQLSSVDKSGRFKLKIISRQIKAYIGAKMIKEADRLVRETPLLDEYEFHSASARYYEALGKRYLDMMIRELNTSIEINPLADEDYYLLAKVYLEHNRFKQSRWMLHKAMVLDPTNILYHSLYSKILYEREGIKIAAGYVRDLLKKYPDEPRLLADLAIYYYRDQQMVNFNELKNKIELQTRKDVSFYDFMIKVSKKEGIIKDVIKYSKGYVLVNPGNVTVRMNLAIYLFDKKKYAASLEEIDRVIERIIAYPKLHALLSKIYTKINSSPSLLNGAISRYLKVIRPDIKKAVSKVMSDNSDYLLSVVELKDEKLKDDLLEEVLNKELDQAFKKIIEKGIITFYKKAVLAIIVKAKISAQMLADDKFFDMFITRILERPFQVAELPDLAQLEANFEIYHNPKIVDGYYALGTVYVKMNDYKNAVANLGKAVSIDLNHTDSLVSLANIRHREGFHDIAKELYERALKLDPSRVLIYKELGKLYQEMGQTSLAIEFFENYLKLDPQTKEKAAIKNRINQLK